jgi:hypothetical protein
MPQTPPPDPLAIEAGDLVTELVDDPLGQVAASLYDTGRLVALAPWLAGHEARLDFLCRRQHPDGSWGGPTGYALVPTLSATGALLTELRRRRYPDRLVQAAIAGLVALHRALDPEPGPVVPDTIASEMVVPALLAEVNALVTALAAASPMVFAPELARPLRPPVGFDPRVLDGARERFADGAFSPRLAYCLEVFGAAAAGSPLVRPAAGVVGCSPAATAAWAGGPHAPREAREFLDTLQARGGGPVPVVAPVSYFEPAWALTNLAAGGLALDVPVALLNRLDTGLTSAGAPVAPSLPPDSDDTSAVLTALLRHGRIRPPDSLLSFQADGYFRCFPDERNPSESVNAHVLEALARYLARRPGERDQFAAPAAMAARWLRDRQHPDGNWWDKWHASPYYATACTVTALLCHGAPESRPAVRRAAAWVRDTQRPDGTWGRWSGTVEETSYAVQVLVLTGGDEAAIRRGCAFLADPPPLAEHPPLWHGKDLYLPVRVVRAARLAALCLGRRGGRAGRRSGVVDQLAGV